MYRILLFTNRDSDNLGDKVMEACDLSLIYVVMQNLGIQDYVIDSYDAEDIFKEEAKKLIADTDLVLIGGAPMFNYLYQNFYERTIITIEYAMTYNKPVVFSAVGIDAYDENDERCQRLKKAINLDCVKMITTRDGYEFLEQYKEREDLIIGKVADPAVFTKKVFEPFLYPKKPANKKKIGIFVLRANGFSDNKINFSKEDAIELWQELTEELESRGYDYELLTSGHFGDEAFLQRLVSEYGFDESRCVFNMDTPELLVQKISSYDAVISCRLHPNIISYALDVPAVGLVWNYKVKAFYESIGYGDRVLEAKDISAQTIINRMECAMREGVHREKNYMMTIYHSLYGGISLSYYQNQGQPSSEAYDFEQLMEKLPSYPGTSKDEQQKNMERKLRTVYKKYNALFNRNIKNRDMAKAWKQAYEGLAPANNGGRTNVGVSQNEGKYKILLLTNRISDNLGDKTIEICDIALIHAAMKNLGITSYTIDSRDATIIPKRYLETMDETLLETAKKAIGGSNVVIFGGAPVFNYTYQIFAERTAVTIEIAKQFGVPVLFSAIGIEGYDENNAKCQKLKRALNYDCVKQITTRDGYEALEKYKENENLVIGKVSDPAVFASKVFERFARPKADNERKKVGIFVLRANGFVDNKIAFSRDDAIKLWMGLAAELNSRGYDYEFLTSGNYGDEAFLDLMTKKHGLSVNRCVFNMDTPEKMFNKISSYDAVISCRLHPSIVSFSEGIPALGIVWNSKVKHFYDSIGYGNRVVYTGSATPENIVDRIEKAIKEGVNRDEDYLLTVYSTLFNGIRMSICPDDISHKAYSYSELIENIPSFEGTTAQEKEDNYKRKFRRVYEGYDNLFEKNIENRSQINRLKAEYVGYPIIYNSGAKDEKITSNYDASKGELKKLDTGSLEYRVQNAGKNDGSTVLLENGFIYPGKTFMGWRIRIKTAGKWLWYMEDESLSENLKGKRKKVFGDEEILPVIRVDFEIMVAEAVWVEEIQYKILYHCGAKPEPGTKKFRQMRHKYKEEDGEVRTLPSLAYELSSKESITNGVEAFLLENKYIYKGHVFLGWHIRVRSGQKWYWYLDDGSLCLKEQYKLSKDEAKVKLFTDKDRIPYINLASIDAVVAEAVWR